VLDERRLAIPEFPGNRRLDGVQNLVERPGIGLLFVVPGITETLRVNGIARLTRDPELRALCAVDGRSPWFVLEVDVRQVFSHCGKAFLRSDLWNPDAWADPATVLSPSRTIADRALEEDRPEQDVRRDVEEDYRPGLY
jgi:predicted pyridoxine 5'-phosphate oxidase superfamily flavin-nucleotide-binding protein